MQDVQNKFCVEFVYTPVINFVMQQNHVPVVRKLLIKNTSGHDFHNIKVEIVSEPDFAVTWQHKIDALLKDESIELTSINLKIAAKYLSELTERVSGTFTLTISANEHIISKD